MAPIVLILFFILQQIIFLYGDIQVVSLFVETISTYKNSFLILNDSWFLHHLI